MSAKVQTKSMASKIGIWIGIIVAIAVVFVVVMCTAGDPKFAEPPADFKAPNN